MSMRIAVDLPPPDVVRTGEWEGKPYWKVPAYDLCRSCMFSVMGMRHSAGETAECAAFHKQAFNCIDVILIRPEHYDDYRVARVTNALCSKA